MHYARAGVHPNVRLHPEIRLVPLLGLMHLRVPFPGTVLGGRRGQGDAGVYDSPLPQPQSLRLQMHVDLLKQTLTQSLPFQEMPEVEDRGLVGQRFRQIQTYEPPDRLGLVEQSLPSRKRGSSMPGSLRL